MPAVTSVSPTGTATLDGLLSGIRWATTSLTYSFPTTASVYGSIYGAGEPTKNFGAFSAVQQAAMRTVMAQYDAVSNLTFTQVTESSTTQGDLRFAESDAPRTAWAYYPSASSIGGDAWFNKSATWFDNPVKGSYGYMTYLHEVGHSLGLKHPHEAEGSFGVMPTSFDSLEYTVMSYRSFVGGSLTSYTNETWGYPQTLMMHDIAAIQRMYGADYTTNATNTVYTWSPTTGEMFVNGVGQGAPGGNRILMTVWDGGGSDTYDFSNYATNLSVDLRPGAWTTTSAGQLANLGSGKLAAGNIANALLHNNDARSLVENARGGAGADRITGNQADNWLWGNAGDDQLFGLEGNDTLVGGAGNDVLDGGAGVDIAVFDGLVSDFRWSQNADGSFSVVDLRAGAPLGTDRLVSIETMRFNDREMAVGVMEAPTVPTTPTSPTPVVDRAPIAVADSYFVAAGGRLRIDKANGVLANDSDPEGKALSAELVTFTRFGTMGFSSDGSLFYSPRKGFVGQDTFTYRVTDGINDSIGTVTINVGNSGPALGNRASGNWAAANELNHQMDNMPAPVTISTKHAHIDTGPAVTTGTVFSAAAFQKANFMFELLA